MSMVKIVEAEFSMEARELMTAPPIAAKMNPKNPFGMIFLIMVGRAASVPPGPVIWSRNNCQAMIPGKTMMNGVISFKKDANMTPN